MINYLKEQCTYFSNRVLPLDHPRQQSWVQTLKTPYALVTPVSDIPYRREKPQRDRSEYTLSVTVIQSQQQFGKQSSISTDPVQGGLIAMAEDVRDKLRHSNFGTYGASLDILPALHVQTSFGDPGFETQTGAHGAASLTFTVKEC